MTRERKSSTEDYCGGCDNEVDRSCCCCGSEARYHRHEDHAFVPLGCDCMRASSDDAPVEPPW